MKFGEYDLTHPTPVHIRDCIGRRLSQGAETAGQYVPQWVKDAVADGIKDACREHDTASQ